MKSGFPGTAATRQTQQQVNKKYQDKVNKKGITGQDFT